MGMHDRVHAAYEPTGCSRGGSSQQEHGAQRHTPSCPSSRRPSLQVSGTLGGPFTGVPQHPPPLPSPHPHLDIFSAAGRRRVPCPISPGNEALELLGYTSLDEERLIGDTSVAYSPSACSESSDQTPIRDEWIHRVLRADLTDVDEHANGLLCVAPVLRGRSHGSLDATACSPLLSRRPKAPRQLTIQTSAKGLTNHQRLVACAFYRAQSLDASLLRQSGGNSEPRPDSAAAWPPHKWADWIAWVEHDFRGAARTRTRRTTTTRPNWPVLPRTLSMPGEAERAAMACPDPDALSEGAGASDVEDAARYVGAAMPCLFEHLYDAHFAPPAGCRSIHQAELSATPKLTPGGSTASSPSSPSPSPSHSPAHRPFGRRRAARQLSFRRRAMAPAVELECRGAYAELEAWRGFDQRDGDGDGCVRSPCEIPVSPRSAPRPPGPLAETTTATATAPAAAAAASPSYARSSSPTLVPDSEGLEWLGTALEVRQRLDWYLELRARIMEELEEEDDDEGGGGGGGGGSSDYHGVGLDHDDDNDSGDSFFNLTSEAENSPFSTLPAAGHSLSKGEGEDEEEEDGAASIWGPGGWLEVAPAPTRP